MDVLFFSSPGLSSARAIRVPRQMREYWEWLEVRGAPLVRDAEEPSGNNRDRPNAILLDST